MILDVLRSPRFVDKSPAQVCATLLDESTFYCSERSMYRYLAADDEVRDRRNQLRHPVYKKPELLAEAPNQIWSWDIERHEALSNRVVMKGHGHQPVAADWLKLRAA